MPITKPESDDSRNPYTYTEEDTSNPFMNFLRAVWHLIWTIVTAPFKLIWHFLKMMNEVRSVVLGLLTFVFLFILAIVLIFVFKPAFAWEPMKGFLNNDIQTPVYQIVSEDNIYWKINGGGMNEIVLTESEVTYLFRKTGMINENSTVGLTDNTITIYFNADTKESPLWVFIKAEIDNTGNLAIKSTGFGRFTMPDFVSNWIASGFNSMIDLLGRQNKNSSLVLVMNQILDSNLVAKTKELASAEIRHQQIILKYNIIGLD